MSYSTQRIAIVGAGPAGASLAWHLSGYGFSDITLLERGDAVGGQSQTVDIDGVPVEMGTCYMSAGYLMAHDFAERMGCHVDLLPPATVVGEDGAEIDRDDPSTWLIVRYLLRWMPWYLRGQMQRPSAASNSERFDAWLDGRGLGPLTSDFTFQAGLTAQLYGPLDAVTAHSALSWIRPSLFITGRLSKTYAVREGFQTFWTRLVAASGAKVEFGRDVEAVATGSDGPRVVLRQGDPRRFDMVFVSAPLDSIETPVSPDLVRSGAFEDSPVYSGVWRAKDWPEFAPSRCYLPACGDGAPGRVLTARRFAERDGLAVGQFCAYGHRDRPADTHRKQALDDLGGILGLSDIELLHDRVWRYNIRFSPDQIRAGLPSRIDDAQGRGGVWYSGGALSHWNIDSITDFNHGLVRRVARAAGVPFWKRGRRVRGGGWSRDL